MKVLAYTLPLLAVMMTGAVADPLAERQELMKERGPLMRVLAPIAQGQQPFDAAVVMDALQKMNDNAQKTTDVEALWPDGTEGGDTKSAPKIWEDKAGFKAASDKFAADAAAAVAASPQDLQSFQAVFGPMSQNCGTCHETFRLRSS
ncbi:cytochrome c [Aquamicrobium sp. LC103]|uniref:c-type cytochrome n=1 Tax=Aquamicrobium sp. LC103 TaxID=1120658 RepID=UPI00063E7C56|nr:cytochrome c [Aquamicrobium sp. LC103]TKT81206.1 cytochrome C556 [Aquamicrobium sp. LC103]